jgi:DNA-binding transcriptional LysR family regulator
MGWQIKLRQLEAFRGVMLSGTTKQAAALMNLSQPAVSRLIQDLEAQLGVALFDRIQGRLQPTREAQALFSEAEEALSHLSRLDAAMRNVGQLSGERLRVAASAAVVYGLMPQVFAMFRERHPKTALSLRIADRRELRDSAEVQDFDVAISMLPIDYPPERLDRLVRVRGVCVLPANHPLGRKRTVHASDVSGYSFISLLPETMARARLDKIFQDLDVKRELGLETQTASALCLLVNAGLGIGVTDPFTAERFAATGILIRPFEPVVEYEYGVLYPINRRPAESALDFTRYLRRALEGFAKHVMP